MQKMSIDLSKRATQPMMTTTSRTSASAASPLNSCTTSTPTTSTGPPPVRFAPLRKPIRTRCRRTPTIATAETTATKPDAVQQQQQQPASEPQTVRITLDETQTAIVGPLLDKHRDASKITGLLAVLAKSFRPAEGCVTLELQLIEVDQRSIAALRKITHVC